MIRSAFLLFSLFLLLAPASRGQNQMTVHEWGTITTRHAPDGRPQGALNRIDASSVLPAFVHRFEPEQASKDPDRKFEKSPSTPGRPDITMRLETPVIYFHLRKGVRPEPFNVSVSFRGGILNEFYPNAEASVTLDSERIASKTEAGVMKWDGNTLNNFVRSTLSWKGLQFSSYVTSPQTDQKAWLAPRNVRADKIMEPGGEGEQYLFYRGVAHLDALVQTELTSSELILKTPKHLAWLGGPSTTMAQLWLVDVRDQGRIAFREPKGFVMSKSDVSRLVERVPLFSANEYSPGNLQRLQNSMKQALVASGLFEDEADAMIATWGESYFGTPGLRLLYIVPKEWIDYHLPLQVSKPSQMKRVIVGRIDLLPLS